MLALIFLILDIRRYMEVCEYIWVYGGIGRYMGYMGVRQRARAPAAGELLSSDRIMTQINATPYWST